jgi:glycosyltransferase involved in cell wall biosynthesis
MDILRVAQKVCPDDTGGGAYHAHAMSRDQAERGHDVTLMTVSRVEDRPRREQRAGYTVVRQPANAEILGNAMSRSVWRFLRSERGFDVVHAHSHLYFSTNLAALDRRLSETPLAVTNHGLYSQAVSKRVFDLYLRTGGRWTFNCADLVFCYTDEERARLRDIGVSTDIAVVPNGIDVGRFTPEGPESDLVDPNEEFVVLFVGRLVEGKRPRDAIEAVERMQTGADGVELYLVGEGPLRPNLQEFVAARGLEEAVTFLGHVDYDEMPGLYRAADVLVLPSRSEGVPRTVLEALATETPVVASDLEQLTPVVGEAGETVPVGNVGAFAAALDRFAGSPDSVCRAGRRGRENVESTYTWEGTVERTTALLEELTGAV